MKKTDNTKKVKDNELEEEYSFDYSNASKNRYADLLSEEQVLFPIDNEVIKVFKMSVDITNSKKKVRRSCDDLFIKPFFKCRRSFYAYKRFNIFWWSGIQFYFNS